MGREKKGTVLIYRARNEENSLPKEKSGEGEFEKNNLRRRGFEGGAALIVAGRKAALSIERKERESVKRENSKGIGRKSYI